MFFHLNVSDPHVSLNIIADHEVSQDATGGDLCLLNDVGAEGDLADVLFVFDHSGDGKLRFGWSTKTGNALTGIKNRRFYNSKSKLVTSPHFMDYKDYKDQPYLIFFYYLSRVLYAIKLY